MKFDLNNVTCPICGEFMQTGFLYVPKGEAIRWSKNKVKPFLGFMYLSPGEPLRKSKKKWYKFDSMASPKQIQAVRCQKCMIGMFFYGDDRLNGKSTPKQEI